MRVTVVGAGVVGLSCAVQLAESGHEVRVVARDLPLRTTSAVAAALWHPYLAFPVERVTTWAGITYDAFAQIAAAEPASGVHLVSGVELRRERGDPPWWAASVAELIKAEPSTLPDGYAEGWSLVSPVVDMPVYLPWLIERAQRADVSLRHAELTHWPVDTDAIVNATGLGGVALHRDSTVYPVRGQVVYVEHADVSQWWLDESGPTYVVPRTRDIVVGGTEEVGSWSTSPDPQIAREILERAAHLEPKIATAKIIGHGAGLRPARPTVRLEREDRVAGPPIIHCYGHGGGGVTLSWGCAEEVAGLLG
jgi:D-amino-acid oxidase